jgi:hypothetical protein
VICPAEVAPLTTTDSIISISTPQVAQPPTTDSTLLTTQAETTTSTKSTTPLSTTSLLTTPRETTETEAAMTTMSEHTAHTGLVFNATMAPGRGNSGAQQTKISHFLPAVLLIIIYNFQIL